jgi:hypothetical protein
MLLEQSRRDRRAASACSTHEQDVDIAAPLQLVLMRVKTWPILRRADARLVRLCRTMPADPGTPRRNTPGTYGMLSGLVTDPAQGRNPVPARRVDNCGEFVTTGPTWRTNDQTKPASRVWLPPGLCGGAGIVMEVREPSSTDSSLGISRRTLLRRGAVVGGVLAWTPPVIITLASPAAGTGTPIESVVRGDPR